MSNLTKDSICQFIGLEFWQPEELNLQVLGTKKRKCLCHGHDCWQIILSDGTFRSDRILLTGSAADMMDNESIKVFYVISVIEWTHSEHHGNEWGITSPKFVEITKCTVQSIGSHRIGVFEKLEFFHPLTPLIAVRHYFHVNTNFILINIIFFCFLIRHLHHKTSAKLLNQPKSWYSNYWIFKKMWSKTTTRATFRMVFISP